MTLTYNSQKYHRGTHREFKGNVVGSKTENLKNVEAYAPKDWIEALIEIGSAISCDVGFAPLIFLLQINVMSELVQRRKDTNMHDELLNHVSQVHTVPHVKSFSTNISE